MSASLVGSEMCIRDRVSTVRLLAEAGRPIQRGPSEPSQGGAPCYGRERSDRATWGAAAQRPA
eukprot:944933-Alexandrium_andersonii.AAC.1